MTPEQKRELWLKRILPALVIVVFYFVLISPYFVVNKYEYIAARYDALVKKRIDPAALYSLEQQQTELGTEIMRLEAEYKALLEKMAASSVFLAESKSPNDTLEQISVIWADNHLQVLDVKRNDRLANAVLSKSLLDTQRWLKEILSPQPATTSSVISPVAALVRNMENKDFNVWTLRYVGKYQDSYRALLMLIEKKAKAIPVSLTMQASKANPGEQEWLLTIWL